MSSLLGGCFAPEPTTGAPCAVDRSCPDGLQCAAATTTCERPGTSPPDAAPDATLEAGFVARFNLAGVAHVGSSENPGMWAADVAGFNRPCSGNDFTAPTMAINGTLDAPLFRTQRFDLDGSLTCTVPNVPVGRYRVRVLWAEIFRGGPPCNGPDAQRSFRVALEGMTVEPSLDVLAVGNGCAAQAGTGMAFVRTYTVDISDGALDLELSPTGSTDGAVINALELVQL